VNWAITQKGYSQRRACGLAGIDPKVYRYQSMRPSDAGVRKRLRELASQRRRFGYRRLHILLKREGVEMNWKKLYRLYKEERLTVRKRGGRKRALGTRAPMAIPQGPNPAVVFGLCLGRLGGQSALPHSMRDRRLQPRMSGDGGRQLVVGRACRARTGPDRRVAGSALHSGQRQRHGVDVQCDLKMAAGSPGGMALHPAG